MEDKYRMDNPLGYPRERDPIQQTRASVAADDLDVPLSLGNGCGVGEVAGRPQRSATVELPLSSGDGRKHLPAPVDTTLQMLAEPTRQEIRDAAELRLAIRRKAWTWFAAGLVMLALLGFGATPLSHLISRGIRLLIGS
jgi:hypothetical protein